MSDIRPIIEDHLKRIGDDFVKNMTDEHRRLMKAGFVKKAQYHTLHKVQDISYLISMYPVRPNGGANVRVQFATEMESLTEYSAHAVRKKST